VIHCGTLEKGAAMTDSIGNIDGVTINDVSVEEFLEGKKQEQLTEESHLVFHQSLHRATQDLSTARQGRSTSARAKVSMSRAAENKVGERGQPYSKNSKVTRYDMWDLAIEGEKNMAYNDVIDALQDSSRRNVYDIEGLLAKLKGTQDRPPLLNQLKSLIRQLWKDGIVNAYCVRAGAFHPYPEHSSTQRMYFILASNDDKREAMELMDENISRQLKGCNAYLIDLFGDFTAEELALVKDNPLKRTLVTKRVYDLSLSRILLQAGVPLSLDDLLVKMQRLGYKINDKSSIRVVLKRMKEAGIVACYVHEDSSFKRVTDGAVSARLYYKLVPFDEMPLDKFMPEEEAIVPVEDEPEPEEIQTGLPQAVDSYDEVIDKIFPVQSDEMIAKVKAGKAKGRPSTWVNGRAIFDIIRTSGKVLGTGAIIKGLRERGHVKATPIVVSSVINILKENGLVNFYISKKGKTTKVDAFGPGVNRHVKFVPPAADRPEIAGGLPAEAIDESPDTVSGEDALPVVNKEATPDHSQDEDRPAQAEFGSQSIDGFVGMLKGMGVKRFEIEF
jgi:hypothetical protein